MTAGIRAAALAALVVTAGCTTMSLEELRRTTPSGSPFHKALTQRYLDFATSEASQYDWIDSMVFADKGLIVAYGGDVEPESLDKWRIPEDIRPEMERARAGLMQALASGAAEAQPEIAADAVFHFDCWVEQQEENWQVDDIARCREGFNEAMETLTGTRAPEKPQAEAKLQKPIHIAGPEEPLEPEMPAAEPAPVVPQAPKATEPPPPPPAPPPAGAAVAPQDVVSYVVFFEEGQTVLSASGKLVIDEVIGVVKPQESYEIVLNGHNDTAEGKKGDFTLSQQRAEAVKQRLMEGGIKEAAIQIFAFGSSDPYVKTSDNVKEPANRRVEIFLND